MSFRRGRDRGFTLIELVIVIAVISIITTMAIPSLWAARKNANEAAAIGSLRSLVTVGSMYRSRFQVFAPALADLQARGYIDSVLGSGQKAGYTFTYVQAGPDAWHCNGDPTTPGTTGDRHFYADDSGVIRVDGAAAATAASPPVE